MSVALDRSPLSAPGSFPAAPIAAVRRLRSAFDSGQTRALEWRREQLDGLRRMLRERHDDLVAAVHADLGKPAVEVMGGELAEAVCEANVARRHLRSWTAPQRVGSLSLPGRRRVHREPAGVVLIASPWCHPMGLLLAPLAGALAAGNAVVLRPPSGAVHTAKLLRRIVPRYLDGDAIAVADGDESQGLALLEERFDHIYYTGGGLLGRLVIESAMRHGTPTTISLLGTSPCVVDAAVDVRAVARRIVRGKFFHAGQTSGAPAYVLVHARREKELLEELAVAIASEHGPDPAQSSRFGRIANPDRCAALARMLREGTVHTGGEVRLDEGYIAPTILTDVSPSAAILSAEALGPILPVLPVSGATEAIDFVNDRGRPLACYVFSDDEHVQELVVEQTRAWSVCVNGIPEAGDRPLNRGEIGAGSLGSHHGKQVFDLFSQRKDVLDRSRGFEAGPIYPAYHRFKTKLVYWRR